jgi:hypothetical protein
MYFKEISKKEDTLMMQSLRRQFDSSNNGILRAMTSHNLMSSMGMNNDSRKLRETMTMSAKLRNSLVDGGDHKLLTRGSLPSSIPAKYDCFPDDQDWNKAEKRYRELEAELREVNSEIDQKKQEVAQDRKLIGGAAIENLRPKTGSHVVGSAFKWRSEGTSNSSSYVWHTSKLSPTKNAADELSLSATANQYGLSTKACDLPEGNILINPNAEKRFKGKLAPPRSANTGRRK